MREICKKCGANLNGANFCVKCGTKSENAKDFNDEALRIPETEQSKFHTFNPDTVKKNEKREQNSTGKKDIKRLIKRIVLIALIVFGSLIALGIIITVIDFNRNKTEEILRDLIIENETEVEENIADNAPVEVASESAEVTSNIIFNASEFNRISVEALRDRLGNESSQESWKSTNYTLINYVYDINGAHYEFSVCENKVVRVSIYSQFYWNGRGSSFIFKGKNKNVAQEFGIELSDNSSVVANTSNAYRIKNPAEGIDDLWIQGIDSTGKNFDVIKITYDESYTK